MSSHALLLQQIDALKQGVAQRDVQIGALRLAIDKLTLELFHLRRMRYGRSSEQMDNGGVQPSGAALAAVQPTPLRRLTNPRALLKWPTLRMHARSARPLPAAPYPANCPGTCRARR
ncbi:hypothetical protein BH10PSE16_BH10PSE16_40460 [soil metagenome]